MHGATSGWQCSTGLFHRAHFWGQSCSMYLSASWMQNLNTSLAISLMVPKWGVAVGSLEGQDALERGLYRLGHWTVIDGMKSDNSS